MKKTSECDVCGKTIQSTTGDRIKTCKDCLRTAETKQRIEAIKNKVQLTDRIKALVYANKKVMTCPFFMGGTLDGEMTIKGEDIPKGFMVYFGVPDEPRIACVDVYFSHVNMGERSGDCVFSVGRYDVAVGTVAINEKDLVRVGLIMQVFNAAHQFALLVKATAGQNFDYSFYIKPAQADFYIKADSDHED